MDMLGVTDCLTKCYGSTNKINVVKATFDGLSKLSERESVAGRRGVEISETVVDEMIQRGEAFLPSESSGEKMQGPVNTIGQDRQRGRGGRGGGGGRGGRGGGGGGGGRGGAPRNDAPPQPDAPAAPAPDAPAS